MTKLWKKSDAKVNPVVEKYTAGTDYLFDMVLMPFDIAGSRAHAKGLEKSGILSKDELKKLLAGLDSLEAYLEAGRGAITPEDEECHTRSENYIGDDARER